MSAAGPQTSATATPSSSMPEFKSMTSLGEVQRIIGLSLSKIQLGKNQRGGLPLHKNLLVATVLNKARDLYMQETMYMNYKMMTGQFMGSQAGMQHHNMMMMHSAAGMMGGSCSMTGMADHGQHQLPPSQEDYDEDGEDESDVEEDSDSNSML